jgi:cytochrome c-type biogenesis protein CcsB
MIVLLVLYATILAVATFVEKAHGTTLTKVFIYYSPAFFFLQFLMVVNFVMIVIKRNFLKLKRWGMLLIHCAFIVILTGAMTTHIFGREGILHLREGDISNRVVMQTNKGTHVFVLPFQVELVKFTLTRYPGSMSPSSYESDLIIHTDNESRPVNISMNNVLDLKGYRFFQASYDADEMGTILSVNKDVAGRTITYFGYLLLFIGSIGCLIGKNGRIRTLFRQLNRKTVVAGVILAGLLFVNVETTSANTPENPMVGIAQRMAIPLAHAERFGALPKQSNSGRLIPINTFSSEILRKIHRDTQFGELNSDQVLLGILAIPDVWMNVPFINHSNDALSDYFGLPKADYISYLDVFRADDGAYKLAAKLQEAYQKMPAERTAFDRDIMKLDEKINILYQLFDFQMINIFPREDSPNHNWYAPGDDLSEFSGQDSTFVSRVFIWYITEVQGALQSGDWSKPNEVLDMIKTYQNAKNNIPEFDMSLIDLELKYNRLQVYQRSKVGYFILGGLLLIFSFIALFRNKPWTKIVIRILLVAILIVFGFHLYGMIMRWKIAGTGPWSNSYETMIFLAWSMVCVGLIFFRRSPLTLALATLFAGVILFVAGLNWLNPQISPLVPVLKSPWLMWHVAVLMVAYGFFGIGCMIGIFNLVVMTFARNKKLGSPHAEAIQDLTIIIEISLLIGLILMAVGSFMGAVWANESWGRYWGWDPKETWALITIIVYTMVTHLRLVKKWYSLWLFNLCAVIAFASVLMTYFGVSYFLSGLHAYN